MKSLNILLRYPCHLLDDSLKQAIQQKIFFYRYITDIFSFCKDWCYLSFGIKIEIYLIFSF